MEAEDARRRHQGEAADVLQVLFVAARGWWQVGGAVHLRVEHEVIV